MNDPIYGQAKLLNILNGFQLDTMPRTIMLLGKTGCGKRMFAKYLADKLHIDMVMINKDNYPTPTELVEYQLSPITRMYVIDLRGLLEKDQNAFLKFIEEPSVNMRVVVLANSTFGVLPTILNRCIRYTFEPYTKADLKNFAWMHESELDLFYKFCDTPGLFIDNTPKNIDSLYATCSSLIKNLPGLDYPVVLSVISKINFKENYDKFDPILFLNMMHYVAVDNYKAIDTELDFKISKITSDFLFQVATIPTLVKENLIINYLTTIWEATR